jgi:hypothetical protein
MLKIVTFATPNYELTYEKHILKSITALKLNKYHIHHRTDRLLDRSWASRTNLKPGIILHEIGQGNDILYVDCDAEIKSKRILDINALIPQKYIGACHFLDWDKWAGGCSGIVEPLTGTLFFRPEAIPMIKDWCILSANSKEPDGKTFAQVIEGRKDIFPLPIEYCYINSLPNGNKGNIPCENPIIVHYQESRNAVR